MVADRIRGNRPDAPPVDEADAMASVEVQASGFRHVREARRTELAEDYVELIDDLIRATGEARPVDIAARLGVAEATVSKMLKRLAQEGLVVKRPYRSVFLTEEGRRLAEDSRARHRIVESFLLALGVSPEVARRDAEGMEHHASPETLQAFEAFVRRTSKGERRS